MPARKSASCSASRDHRCPSSGRPTRSCSPRCCSSPHGSGGWCCWRACPPLRSSRRRKGGWLRTASRQRRLEAALLALSVLGAAYLVFHTPLGVASSLPALLYAPVPVLLWAALRFGVGGSSAALLGLTLLAATSQAESAVFETRSPAAGELALQVFLIVASTPTLLLAALGQERGQATEALRRSEMRFRRLADSGMIGLKVGDGEGHIVAANDAFLALVGYSREDLAAGRLNSAAMTPPDYAAQDARAAAQLRTARTCAPYEKEYVRKDGSRVPVMIGGGSPEGGGRLEDGGRMGEDKGGGPPAVFGVV